MNHQVSVHSRSVRLQSAIVVHVPVLYLHKLTSSNVVYKTVAWCVCVYVGVQGGCVCRCAGVGVCEIALNKM